MAGVTLGSLSPLARIDAFSNGLLMPINGERWSALATLAPLHNLVVNEVGQQGGDASLKNALLGILSCLRAVDYAFEHKLNYRKHVYVYDDASLHALLAIEGSTGGSSHVGDLGQLLEVLGCLGLIYRFNVAPKFGLDEGKMQLRLNGWGRIACDEYGLEATSAFRNVLDYVTGALGSCEESYRSLLSLCNSDDRPLDTAAIAMIVVSIPLTVVT